MEAMGIIFSNIYDNNMGELTRERTSASIPFGSRYRQIDFALSNMANSKISNIGIVTKYNYQSLMDHLGNCEEWDLKLGEGVRFLPPYATGHTGAYRGKLEALQTAMPVLGRCDAEYVVLSDTTVLCAINFAAVLDERDRNARHCCCCTHHFLSCLLYSPYYCCAVRQFLQMEPTEKPDDLSGTRQLEKGLYKRPVLAVYEKHLRFRSRCNYFPHSYWTCAFMRHILQAY